MKKTAYRTTAKNKTRIRWFFELSGDLNYD